MRKTLWSTFLVVVGLFSLPAVAAEPPGQQTGTRVAIRLTEAGGQLPEPQKAVDALMAVGGTERQVRVMRRDTSGQQELTLELWGDTVPQADIPRTLRDAFPALASADIQVSTLEWKDRPKREACDVEDGAPGEPGQVKNVVKIIKRKE